MYLLKEILFPFLMGGTIISTVKFTATHLDNPALAAIFGGLPIGLISIYFLSEQNSVKYARNYFFVTLSLLSAIIVFYLLSVYTKLSSNKILTISIVTWLILVSIRYFIANNISRRSKTF